MIVQTVLTDIAHGGACVGRAEDGRAVFARFGLPGEKVAVQVTRSRSKLLRGDVVEVLADASEHRVDHPWPEAGPGGVGGADLGHVAFGYQSQWKTSVLRSTIRRIGGPGLAEHLEDRGIEAQVRPFEADAVCGGWGTRTRIEMVADGALRPSMHKEGSAEAVALERMPLGVEELEALDVFSGAWRHWLEPAIRIRAVAPSGSDPVLVLGNRVYWAPGMEASSFVREDVVVDGVLYSYRVRASGFWQVHREGAAELVRLVLEGAQVGQGDRVLELYSGAGLLTQPLAAAVGPTGSVQAFEGVRMAVEDARANLREFPWATSRTASIGVRRAAGFLAETPDVIVADPPRAGLGIPLAQTLAECGARTIVLVSCDPASMARDVAAMVEAGREVSSIRSVDMFPNTHHFETVTTLVRP